jgi:hypothetical protein
MPWLLRATGSLLMRVVIAQCGVWNSRKREPPAGRVADPAPV